MLTAVTIHEIRKIFEVLDRLEISREWVTIPLTPASPGAIKRLPGGKFEIVVDAEVPIDEWTATLESEILRLLGNAK
ncbi:MAG: hypothetical protein HZA23_05675 [Nitrospirae bacterium]|nr:hypothetical protein [Nitrospirota bacterium]